MYINEYVEVSGRTNLSAEQRGEVRGRLNDDLVDLFHASIGMTTEVGELSDVVKKHLFYNKPIDWVNLAEEIGDIMWYVALAARVVEKNTGKPLSRILDENINKLKKRYPDSFSYDKAVSRDLVGERKELESWGVEG